jgi:hypothetical protein
LSVLVVAVAADLVVVVVVELLKAQHFSKLKLLGQVLLQ